MFAAVDSLQMPKHYHRVDVGTERRAGFYVFNDTQG